MSVRLSVRFFFVFFTFPNDNMRKYQWIFTKLGMCIDIVEIYFGIANGQISTIFYLIIRPFEKRDVLCYGVWCLSVRKLFRFRLTPPTVYIRSS